MMTRRLALLRAVNVGGRKLAMAELRAIAAHLGWKEIETHIQSGNLLFSADGQPAELEAALEDMLADKRGIKVPVMIRDAKEWDRILSANPFPDAERDEPARLLLMISKRPVAPDAAESLAERAASGERVAAGGGAIWIHYPAGVARSRITPASIDRACGMPATGRNVRVARRLAELLRR